jgi:hypothetical protein
MPQLAVSPFVMTPNWLGQIPATLHHITSERDLALNEPVEILRTTGIGVFGQTKTQMRLSGSVWHRRLKRFLLLHF